MQKNTKKQTIYKALTAKMIIQTIRHSLLASFVALFLSACYSTSPRSDWPTDLPPKSVFVDAYNKQVQMGTNDGKLKAHLFWIKRFYRGAVVYIGWNDMTEMVLDSLNGESQEKLNKTRERLDKLGKKIVIEWAQHNDHRNINSASIATWGNALRTSVKRNETFWFLDQVEKDVDALINHKLDLNNIKRERYYPPENFDDF